MIITFISFLVQLIPVHAGHVQSVCDEKDLLPKGREATENCATGQPYAKAHREAHFNAVPATGTGLIMAHGHWHFDVFRVWWVFSSFLDKYVGHIEFYLLLW